LQALLENKEGSVLCTPPLENKEGSVLCTPHLKKGGEYVM